MKKTVLITGATSGFGKATAKLLANSGFRLILTGRRKERLDELSADLLAENGIEVQVLCFDVRNNESVVKAISGLPEKWKEIDVLVNNAGLAAGTEPIQNGVLDNWERMIDTNVKGLLYVTRAILPHMVKRKSGHIVNVGSTAGKEAYAGGNVYCATKHAVDAISKGMRIDLVKEGIKVSQVRPGLAQTEFSVVRFHGDQQKADNVYAGLEPLVAEDIADAVQYIITRPPHVCINDLEVTCTAQANSTVVFREE